MAGIILVALTLAGCEIGTCRSLAELPVPRAGLAQQGLGWGLDGCGSFFAQNCAADVFRRITDRLGGQDLRIALVRLARTTLFLRAQVPGHSDEFDDYTVDLDGNLSRPLPVKRNSGDGLEERLFRASDVSVDLVPTFRRRALAALRIEAGRVTSISFAPSPGGPLRVDVDASSPRGNGSAIFDTQGQMLSISRP